MKKLLSIIFLINSFIVFGQGEANFWYFGRNAGINFNTSPPTPITGSLNTIEGCASFSDKNGNLLFYSDGTSVWDKNGNLMPNGSNLKGNPSSSQSAIIVPHPGNTDLFYIFTVGSNINNIPTEGLNCYLVDMTANNGLGDVVGAPIDLSDGLNSQWTEKVTSVKGADCNTFWVVSLVNNTYYSYKIDNITGLNTLPVISTVNYDSTNPRGYLKASPDGKKLASATFTQFYGNNGNVIGNGKLHLYSFDDLTGKVSNDGIEIISNAQIDGAPYGVEFSPLSSKLYTATFDGATNKLFQYDLLNPNIVSSKYLVSSQTGYRGALQLAPNGKIYATVPLNYNNGTNYLNAINFPEELGINCDFQLNDLYLGSGYAMQGLPPFIASLLLPVEITDGITSQNINKTTTKRCLGDSFQLTAQNISGSPTYKWIFNNTIVSTTSTLNTGILTNASAGTYFLEIETTDDCGFRISYKGEVSIEVYNPPTILKPTNILQCDTDNDGFYEFDFKNLKDLEILNGQNNSEFEILYFTNQTDADANTNPILNPFTNTNPYTQETIIARIHNIQNPNCYKTEPFSIQVYESPNPPVTISNLTTCDTNTIGTDVDGIEIFNLKDKEIEILNGQSASDFTITYYTDALLTNQIVNPTAFQNNINNQPIYVKIINNLDSSCVTNTSFIVEVFSLPVINNSFVFKQCDEDGVSDGITDFNLNEANSYLTNGDTSLEVTYYLNSNDANLGTNEISPFPFSNAIQSTVYAKIENSFGCHRIAQIALLVSATRFPANYVKEMISCDDDDIIDGLHLFNLAENSAEIISQFPSGQNLKVSYYRTLSDAQLEQNELPTNQPYFSENPFSQTIYVRVESNDNGECFGLGPHLELTVNPRPEFELDPTAIYCKNLPPITVSTFNNNGNFTYQWKDEQGNLISTDYYATISKEGNYTVIATSSNGCDSFPKTITIEASVIASISQNDISIVDDSLENSITILTNSLGIGDYEFALDNEFDHYQDEPFFNNVDPGIHTIFIRDKNNCGTAQIDVSVIGYPKFFTPNNDGENDTWKILGVNETFYATSNIYIFDRYGKLITQIDPSGDGWDGVFNGQHLPATDYWFSVELKDNNGNIKIRKGHFSLIRR